MKKYTAILVLICITRIWGLTTYSRFRTFGENPCKYCSNHIACNSTWKFSKNCYPDAKFVPMTPDLRDFLLEAHNDHRNKLAGGKVDDFKPAIRMAYMSWNSELEYLAALNLLQCEMAHDKCRRTPNYPYVGQNLAYLKWRTFDFELKKVLKYLVDYWFNEKQYFTMEDIETFPQRPAGAPLIGHFTMMAQERANQVGCSVLRQTSNDGVNEVYLACDYSFTNFYTVPVYRPGKVASNCTTGVHPKFKSLCSAKEKYGTKARYS